MSGFYKYFKENMEALGLPAPESLYGNAQLALSSAGTLVGLLERFGTRVTVRGGDREKLGRWSFDCRRVARGSDESSAPPLVTGSLDAAPRDIQKEE